MRIEDNGTKTVFEKDDFKSDDDKKKSQSTLLLELAAQCDLFHGPDSTAYAAIQVNGHREIWKVRSQAFKKWLNFQLFKLIQKGANSQAMNDALCTIEARALFEYPEKDVYTRVAYLSGKVCIDLCDDCWQSIEIDSSGWTLVKKSSVMFLRTNGCQPLPSPQHGGNVDELKTILNIRDDDFVLVVGWLLMAIRGKGDFPVLVINGEHGSAKSTLTRIIRELVDPSTVPLRGMWRTEDDMLVSASKSWCVVVDNLSGLSRDMSDAICRLSTGGGLSKRQLYTNDEEILLDVQRPVILNGIDSIVTRSDLLNRSMILNLPTIAEDNLLEKDDVLARFNAMRAKVFGALLDGISGALNKAAETRIPKLPRMTSFAIWVTAAEESIGWEGGKFIEAYRKNINLGVELTVECSAVGSALRTFINERGAWKGNASELLNELGKIVSIQEAKEKYWPKSGSALSSRISNLMPALRKIGIKVNIDREKSTRWIEIERVRKTASSSSPASSN